MKIISDKVLKNGQRKLVIYADPNEKITSFVCNGYYRTGYPLEDIRRGGALLGSQQVTWCEIEQRWVD